MTIVDNLTAVLGEKKVRVDDKARNERRHDYWFLSALDEAQGRLVEKPRCVVRPVRVEDIVVTVNACREAGVALIPFGLGSGVCGGVRANPESVVLDMSTMDSVREIDPVNLIASFDAGYQWCTC